jgi:hypothetical protein
MFRIGDALKLPLPRGFANLVFTSPPYEDARTYGIDFRLRGQEWVDWAVPRFMECLRICKGLVAWVVEGKTRQFRYSATPILFMADLHRRGVHLRKPPAFHRVGIAGSGGPDWLRNDYEFIVCATNGGKLPWSDNTALGHPPKYAPGGEMCHRLTDGQRVNQWGHSFDSGGTSGNKDNKTCGAALPSHKVVTEYDPPVLANPGNVIKCNVGGGVMGNRLCHENEAPFPEKLAEFFIRSFCPPGGLVVDPFSGSGTTVCVAEQFGRRGLGYDIRESQVELGDRRLTDVRAAQAAKVASGAA